MAAAQDNRFNTFTNDGEVRSNIRSSVPLATRKKSKWGINILSEYNTARNQSILNSSSSELMVLKEYAEFVKDDLAFLLPKFIFDVRKTDGSRYPPESLRQLLCAIFHYYRFEKDKTWDFFRDPEFLESRQALDAAMKIATKDGLGLKKRRAEFIPVDLEEQLWEDGHLGTDSPKQLLATILYLIGMHYGLRARKEHRQLRFGRNSQFQILEDPVTKESLLRYTEDCQKTRNGGLYERNIEPKVIDRYETGNPHNIVKVFKCYIAHRPTSGKNIGNFYLQPLETPRQDIWFKDQAVGENKIGKMIKDLFEEAGINGHFTNHSLRRSKVTRMFQAGAQKNEVMRETGHRSDAGVLTYREFSRTEKMSFQMMIEPTQKVPCKMQEQNEVAYLHGEKENESKIHIVVRNGDKSVDINL